MNTFIIGTGVEQNDVYAHGKKETDYSINLP
jgi:hypothetical protein